MIAGFNTKSFLMKNVKKLEVNIRKLIAKIQVTPNPVDECGITYRTKNGMRINSGMILKNPGIDFNNKYINILERRIGRCK